MSEILFYSLFLIPLLSIIGVLFFPIRFTIGMKWGSEFKFRIWLWNISMTRYQLFFKRTINVFLGGLNLAEKVIKKIMAFYRFLKKQASRSNVKMKGSLDDVVIYTELNSKNDTIETKTKNRLTDAELMREVIDDIAESVKAKKDETVEKKDISYTKKICSDDNVVAPKVKKKRSKTREYRFIKIYKIFKTRIQSFRGYLDKFQSFYKGEKTVLLKTLGWGVKVLWRLKNLLSIKFRKIDLKIGTDNPYKSSKILVYKPFTDLISPFKENNVEIEWTKPIFEGEILIEVDHKIYKSIVYLLQFMWTFPWATMWLRFWIWFRPVIIKKIPFKKIVN